MSASHKVMQELLANESSSSPITPITSRPALASQSPNSAFLHSMGGLTIQLASMSLEERTQFVKDCQRLINEQKKIIIKAQSPISRSHYEMGGDDSVLGGLDDDNEIACPLNFEPAASEPVAPNIAIVTPKEPIDTSEPSEDTSEPSEPTKRAYGKTQRSQIANSLRCAITDAVNNNSKVQKALPGKKAQSSLECSSSVVKASSGKGKKGTRFFSVEIRCEYKKAKKPLTEQTTNINYQG